MGSVMYSLARGTGTRFPALVGRLVAGGEGALVCGSDEAARVRGIHAAVRGVPGRRGCGVLGAAGAGRCEMAGGGRGGGGGCGGSFSRGGWCTGGLPAVAWVAGARAGLWGLG